MAKHVGRFQKALEGTGVQVEECDPKTGVITLDTDGYHISIVAQGSEIDLTVEKKEERDGK